TGLQRVWRAVVSVRGQRLGPASCGDETEAQHRLGRRLRITRDLCLSRAAGASRPVHPDAPVRVVLRGHGGGDVSLAASWRTRQRRAARPALGLLPLRAGAERGGDRLLSVQERQLRRRDQRAALADLADADLAAYPAAGAGLAGPAHLGPGAGAGAAGPVG